MADDDSKPAPFEEGLRRLTVKQLKDLSAATNAELQRRLGDEKSKAPPGALSDDEFKAWKESLLESA
jgi:hypothetical protein